MGCRSHASTQVPAGRGAPSAVGGQGFGEGEIEGGGGEGEGSGGDGEYPVALPPSVLCSGSVAARW